MNELTITEVFFIITGVAIVIITILIGIALFYLITFLRTVRTVAKTAKRASEIVSEDLSDLRQNIKEKGLNLGAVAKFANNIRRKRIYPKKGK